MGLDRDAQEEENERLNEERARNIRGLRPLGEFEEVNRNFYQSMRAFVDSFNEFLNDPKAISLFNFSKAEGEQIESYLSHYEILANNAFPDLKAPQVLDEKSPQPEEINRILGEYAAILNSPDTQERLNKMYKAFTSGTNIHLDFIKFMQDFEKKHKEAFAAYGMNMNTILTNYYRKQGLVGNNEVVRLNDQITKVYQLGLRLPMPLKEAYENNKKAAEVSGREPLSNLNDFKMANEKAFTERARLLNEAILAKPEVAPLKNTNKKAKDKVKKKRHLSLRRVLSTGKMFEQLNTKTPGRKAAKSDPIKPVNFEISLPKDPSPSNSPTLSKREGMSKAAVKRKPKAGIEAEKQKEKTQELTDRPPTPRRR